MNKAIKPLKQFTIVPLTLHRIQNSNIVKLRSFQEQQLLKRKSYDLVLHDGLVLPIDPKKGFTTPNGMSLRPPTEQMLQVLQNFRGSPLVYTFHGGMKLPEGLCIYHEHTDHYSLQTTVPIPLTELNKKLTHLVSSLPVQTREEFIEQWNDFDDQDN